LGSGEGGAERGALTEEGTAGEAAGRHGGDSSARGGVSARGRRGNIPDLAGSILGLEPLA
jgi:hypothetical protein